MIMSAKKILPILFTPSYSTTYKLALSSHLHTAQHTSWPSVHTFIQHNTQAGPQFVVPSDIG